MDGRTVTVFLAAFWLAGVSARMLVYVNNPKSGNTNGIRYLRQDDAHLVDTTWNNYALSAPDHFQPLEWASISVNGDEVDIYTNGCELITRRMGELSRQEKGALSLASAELLSVEMQDTPSDDVSAIRFVNKLLVTGLSNTFDIELNSDSVSLHEVNSDNFSLFVKSYPNNLDRVFKIGALLGLVFKDGRVQMKPVRCLEPNEQRFLDRFLAGVAQFREHIKVSNEELAALNSEIQHQRRAIGFLEQQIRSLRSAQQTSNPNLPALIMSVASKKSEMDRAFKSMNQVRGSMDLTRSRLQEILYALNLELEQSLQGLL